MLKIVRVFEVTESSTDRLIDKYLVDNTNLDIKKILEELNADSNIAGDLSLDDNIKEITVLDLDNRKTFKISILNQEDYLLNIMKEIETGNCDLVNY